MNKKKTKKHLNLCDVFDQRTGRRRLMPGCSELSAFPVSKLSASIRPVVVVDSRVIGGSA